MSGGSQDIINKIMLTTDLTVEGDFPKRLIRIILSIKRTREIRARTMVIIPPMTPIHAPVPAA